MKPWQWMMLRIYGFTFGQVPVMSAALKKILIFILIKRSRRKYVAASRYFDFKEFLKNKESFEPNHFQSPILPSGPANDDFHKVLFACLIVLFGVLIYLPSFNVLPYLVQGDLGRDLYAYQRTLSGELPYRDYYYTYGPLMHYYYALFFKFFGVTVPSILLGKALLQVLSSLAVYFILVRWVEPVMAMLAGCWLCAFSPNFLYTFNNIGAVFFLLVQIYLLLRYLEDRRRSWLWRMVPILSALLLIKLNIGGVVWAASIFLILVISWHEKRTKIFQKILSDTVVLSLPVVLTGLVYGALFWGLPDYYVKQCLPVLPGYDQFRDAIPLLGRLKIFWWDMLAHLRGLALDGSSTSFFPVYWSYQVLFLTFVSSLGLFITFFFRNNFRKTFNLQYLLVSGIFLVFALVLFHEFLLTGILYKLWPVFPVMVLGSFFLAGVVMKTMHVYKVAIVTLCLGILALQVQGKYAFKSEISKYPQQYLFDPHLKIYVNNPPEWIKTVSSATGYLSSNLKADERFLAIPYEPLYYYLTEQRSPVREIMVFDFVHVPPEQEVQMMERLKEQKVNYVLLSNRVKSTEPGMGEFGKTYCPNLAKYIDAHFREVASFGDWNQSAGWFAPHAVKIYKRIPNENISKY